MKILLTLILFMGICVLAYADTVYEKGDDDYHLKVTDTTEKVTIAQYTRPELSTERARKLDEITANYNSYIARDAALRAELADIDTRISEAVKLNIKESAEVIEP